MSDCVTRLINLCSTRMRGNGAKPIFQTLIVDESHFLKKYVVSQFERTLAAPSLSWSLTHSFPFLLVP
jgi:hypothetical protein